MLTTFRIARRLGRSGVNLNTRRAYQSVVHVPDPAPLAVWGEDLQCGDGLTPEYSDRAEICTLHSASDIETHLHP